MKTLGNPLESKRLRKQYFLGKLHEEIQMKMTRYSEPQILAILRPAEGGVPVAELCREHGMSTASFYKWRAKYGGMHCTAGYREAMSREWIRR